MKLLFESGAQSWSLTCNPAAAPRTSSALLANLPQTLQLHTPKIAGSHIYWHAPFVEDVENEVPVLDAKPGAFIYWPVRQFLEITFAPLQAETAAVTVLGQLDGPVDEIVALGQALRENQGKAHFDGRLSLLSQGSYRPLPQPASGVPADIVADRRALWECQPGDLQEAILSRGIMHPAGPILMAESEARVLHEILWWVRARIGKEEETVLRKMAALALDKAAVRLKDFCHLDQSAGLLYRVAAAMADERISVRDLLEEAILVAGRLAAWIDLLIPWNSLNESFRTALDEPAVHPDRPAPLEAYGAAL